MYIYIFPWVTPLEMFRNSMCFIEIGRIRWIPSKGVSPGVCFPWDHI